jgi:cytochrome b subunit of formate dehydrogenase
VVLSDACGSCHTDELPAHAAAGDEAPACVQCHTFLPIAESLRGMSVLCADCHTDERSELAAGGHREALAEEPNEDLPTCLSCHGGHVDAADEQAYTRLAATRKCIECHSRPELIAEYGLPENVGPSFAEDYHGATVQFLLNHPEGEGQPAVMICSDCHGAHEVGWTDPALVAEVCTGSCHQSGDERLAGAWLGHDPIGPENQTLVWLVRVFYYGLIPFMLGGLFINIVFQLVHERRKGARVLKTAGARRLLARLRGETLPPEESIERFSTTERVEHLGALITFVMLVVTGLPQTRPDLGIANAIIGFCGGIAGTRLAHRIMGFLFAALMVVHVARAVLKAVRTRRLPVMVATRKDFEDVLQTFRHMLLKAARPRFGKFDLAAKFEYWGLFLGGIVMSTTGLILIFPELLTQFLPGQIVAATRVMHGLEATFAVLVVVLWHSWGVIFRPEIFPLDTTIFSGRMSVERLREEHPLEYERLFPEAAAASEPGPGPGIPRSARERGLPN